MRWIRVRVLANKTHFLSSLDVFFACPMILSLDTFLHLWGCFQKQT